MRGVPVITEIDTTLTMDPGDLAGKITGKTKAIIPVHTMGFAARMDEIAENAAEHSLPGLEGGVLSTENDEIVARARAYANHGRVMEDPHAPQGSDPRRFPGFNFRMSELQGAVGLAQLSEDGYGYRAPAKSKTADTGWIFRSCGNRT